MQDKSDAGEVSDLMRDTNTRRRESATRCEADMGMANQGQGRARDKELDWASNDDYDTFKSRSDKVDWVDEDERKQKQQTS